MMIISFARTTAALKARRKTVTRRDWSDRHAAMFKVGDLVQAWSASPHRGGKRIGTIRIVALDREPTRLIPATDWEAEGFAFMQENGIDLGEELSCQQCWEKWRCDPNLVVWAIRFEVVEIFADIPYGWKVLR